MSFMFNPHPFTDPLAVNRPNVSEAAVESMIEGNIKIANVLTDCIEGNVYTIAFDGYSTAVFENIINLIAGNLKKNNVKYDIVNVADFYKDAKELESNFSELLPEDRVVDPVLLFGKRLDGGYENIFDVKKLNLFKEKLKNNDKVLLVYGFGSTFDAEIRKFFNKIVFIDVIPKAAILRAKDGKFVNIGDTYARPFKELMRRAYYVDFELALKLRRQLLHLGAIDFYIDGSKLDNYKMLPKKYFYEITSTLSKMPFRTRPVYIEGVWGGQYIKNLRNIDTAKNVAWSFDFIPAEVSVAIELGNKLIELPFYTFLETSESAIMGKECAEKFEGYFPIRFNYDDTFHSSGNMSIQVHSGEKYNIENYNEFGRQDESYYVVVAGHGAKTYVGFTDECDPNEFLSLAKKSEKEHTYIDYQKYINGEISHPGLQVMIPAGTIHASGRNQVILEIGSLTIGSYTYKLYDYLRKDLDGMPRPIHTYHGERVLEKERKKKWVEKNIAVPPRVVREEEYGRELVLGEHNLLYFSLRQIEFEKEFYDDTNGFFHVLSLVDGEDVIIESIDNPEYCFHQKYMDIVVVPANMGKYRIRNLGNQPVKIHKTRLKDGYLDE